MKPNKMKPEEYTVPAGNECACASRLEAENIARRFKFIGDKMQLMILTTATGEKPCCWCATDEKNMPIGWLNLFKEDPFPNTLPISGHLIEKGEYLRHGTDIYILLYDKILGEVLRKIAIYASTLEADVAYRLSTSGQKDQTPEEYPEYYLIRLTENDNPRQTLCYAWYIEKEPNLFLQPIFCEDEEKFFATNRNNLNWEFLHEGDTFWHDNRTYQVCKDENNDYYIAPLCPAMQVIKCNL